MSSEIIEATFRYSQYHRTELMLIASKNQIDYNGGYVNSWTTDEYVEFVEEMREEYPHSNVKLCRDHCGPGFNGVYDLDDTYKTIESDVKNGFELIHIDFCYFNSMYNKDTINSIGKHYMNIIENIITNSDKNVLEFNILSDDENYQLISELAINDEQIPLIEFDLL